MNRLYKILGISLVISGVVLNEWTIKVISQGQVKFAETEKQIFLAIVDICLIFLGLLIFRYKKTVLQNLLLVICSIFFSFWVLEIGLNHVPSNLETDSPIWIPYKQKMLNNQINQIHQDKAKLNSYGFNSNSRRHPEVA